MPQRTAGVAMVNLQISEDRLLYAPGLRGVGSRRSRGLATMTDIQHIKYRTINGREYMLVEYAVENMRAMAGDAIDVAAEMIANWPADRSLADLTEAIRGLKPDIKTGVIEMLREKTAARPDY